MKKFNEILRNNVICGAGIVWAEKQENPREFWNECQRGDWMLTLAKFLGVDKKLLILAGAHCANTVRHLMTDIRCYKAIEIALEYCDGKRSDVQLVSAGEGAMYAADVMAKDDCASSTIYAPSHYAAAAAALYAHSKWPYAFQDEYSKDSQCNSAHYTVVAVSNNARFGMGSSYIYAAKVKNLEDTAEICLKYLTTEVFKKIKELGLE